MSMWSSDRPPPAPSPVQENTNDGGFKEEKRAPQGRRRLNQFLNVAIIMLILHQGSSGIWFQGVDESIDESASVHDFRGSPTGEFPENRGSSALRFLLTLPHGPILWWKRAALRRRRDALKAGEVSPDNSDVDLGIIPDPEATPAGKKVTVPLPGGRQGVAFVKGRGSPTVVVHAGSLSLASELQQRLSVLSRTVVVVPSGLVRPDATSPPDEAVPIPYRPINARKSDHQRNVMLASAPIPTSDREADELVAAMRAIDLDDDVVLLAANYNWLSALKFAKRNKQNVAAVVLLDPYLPSPDHGLSDAEPRIEPPTVSSRNMTALAATLVSPAHLRQQFLLPQHVLNERLFRHALFWVPEYREFTMNHFSAPADEFIGGPFTTVPIGLYARACPRVEYLARQILCMKLEDYWWKSQFAKEAGDGSVAAITSLLPAQKPSWYESLLLPLPDLLSFCMKEIATLEGRITDYDEGDPTASAGRNGTSSPSHENAPPVPDWTRTSEHESGLLQLARRRFRPEHLGVPVDVLLTTLSKNQLDTPIVREGPLGSVIQRSPSRWERALREVLVQRSAYLAKTWGQVYRNRYLVHARMSKPHDQPRGGSQCEPMQPEYREVADHLGRLVRHLREKRNNRG